MLPSRCYHSCQGKEDWILNAMWYPPVSSSLSSLRSVQTKRKSVANNNNNNNNNKKCDDGSNGALEHGRRKLDTQAVVIGRSKRGYGGSPNRGSLASPVHGKRYYNNNNNNNKKDGNGACRKGRRSDGQCSGGLVMEKVIILKRGQTIRDVAAGPSDDADMARVWGCSKENWFETPDRVRDDRDARSSGGCDVRLGEIGFQDVQNKAEQTWRPWEDPGITSKARPGPDPSTILPELGASGGCRGSEEEEEEEEKKEEEESSSSSSSWASPMFMLEKWAGPPYCRSPSPRCLPLPKFSMQHKVTSNGKDSADFAGLQMENGDCSASKTLNQTLLSLPIFRSCANLIPQAGVDAFATRGLRRLLHLD